MKERKVLEARKTRHRSCAHVGMALDTLPAMLVNFHNHKECDEGSKEFEISRKPPSLALSPPREFTASSIGLPWIKRVGFLSEINSPAQKEGKTAGTFWLLPSWAHHL